jgi:hypothetical protein
MQELIEIPIVLDTCAQCYKWEVKTEKNRAEQRERERERERVKSEGIQDSIGRCMDRVDGRGTDCATERNSCDLVGSGFFRARKILCSPRYI